MLTSSFQTICQRHLISPEATRILIETAHVDPEQVRALCREYGCRDDYRWMIRDGVLWLAEPIVDDVEPFAFLSDLARILEAAYTEFFYEDDETGLEFEEWLSQAPPVTLSCEGYYWIARIGNWRIWVRCNDLTYTVMTKMTRDGYCRPGCTCPRCEFVQERTITIA